MSIDKQLEELRALCATTTDNRVETLVAGMTIRPDGLYEPSHSVIDVFFPPGEQHEGADHWTPANKRESVFRRVNEIVAVGLAEAEAEKVAAAGGEYPHAKVIAARRAARHAVGRALGDFA